MQAHSYRAHGKLMLFGEYFVLDGCTALAWPTRFGQTLKVSSDSVQVRGIYWKSIDHKGFIWFEAYFDEELNLLHGLQDEVAARLQKFLLHARAMNPAFLKDGLYHEAEISADYPSEWGLGSSSTLISLIAQWAKVDAMELFFRSFTGSGYDIACAQAQGPISYRLSAPTKAEWKDIDLGSFLDQGVHFIYLGQKQDSREGIQHYREQNDKSATLEQLNKLIINFEQEANRENLIKTMQQSEALIGETLYLAQVHNTLFSDFPGAIKSLGAWGGDFIMAVAFDRAFNTHGYFHEKGHDVVFTAADILLPS